MNDISQILISGIIGTLLGLNSKIIYDWLKTPKNRNNTGKFVIREVCELKHTELNKLLNLQFETLQTTLEDIKKSIEGIKK
jgi:hypothetical protein